MGILDSIKSAGNSAVHAYQSQSPIVKVLEGAALGPVGIVAAIASDPKISTFVATQANIAVKDVKSVTNAIKNDVISVGNKIKSEAEGALSFMKYIPIVGCALVVLFIYSKVK